MTYVEETIHINNETLILNNLRVVYWPEKDALILSDLHIGKPRHFRKHGIPISANVQQEDLDRLGFLIKLYDPKQLIIVGDMFHTGHISEVESFLNWFKTYPDLTVHLIKGNHDRIPSSIEMSERMIVYNNHYEISPFVFVHDPENSDDKFVISGHIHPGVRIKSRGRPGITLPCFMISNSCLVLPAFSNFTGLVVARRKRSDRYYAFTETSFFEF